ncbi:GGDEF domain-containing protein [Pseudemcibacter aquimaris]|uniref:GGDEF domain-containing protein n=1 Tax=Pseudemcibacter aquimaris TaxID=2857064 RepID=UPI002013153E|nr:GGDEF domain-containing protein [Pseudemcibacter aquimaris]MCC3860484.1 GGDEF domain-containing protein [Pseudemcibacter aquimaris]WDU59309.1 GGDEF domain-containing protein [Pseudemcibacter aquimaris]
MNIIQYSQENQLDHSNFKISEKASELVKKFHQSADGLTLKNWKALSEILDYAAAAEQTIAEQKAYISNLESMASTDMLTGLLNKQGFEYEVSAAIARAKRFGEQSLFAYLDLDKFKIINDSFGHKIGDEILLKIGTLLAQSIRQTDFAARIYGDEFGILLNKCDIEKAKERAGYIRHKLRKITVMHEGHEIHVSASLGYAIIDSNSSLEEIFHEADLSMYQNKNERKRTKNRYHMS